VGARGRYSQCVKNAPSCDAVNDCFAGRWRSILYAARNAESCGIPIRGRSDQNCDLPRDPGWGRVAANVLKPILPEVTAWRRSALGWVLWQNTHKFLSSFETWVPCLFLDGAITTGLPAPALSGTEPFSNLVLNLFSVHLSIPWSKLDGILAFLSIFHHRTFPPVFHLEFDTFCRHTKVLIGHIREFLKSNALCRPR